MKSTISILAARRSAIRIAALVAVIGSLITTVTPCRASHSYDAGSDYDYKPGTHLVPSEGNGIAVPESSTFIAGALMLLPLGAIALRMIRKKKSV